MLRMNLGTSVGSRRPLFHFEESQVHERINISIGSSDKLTDVQQEVEQEEDVVEEELEKKPARYNTLCYYYWHAKGGCTRPDCCFIHDVPKFKDQDTSSTKPSEFTESVSAQHSSPNGEARHRSSRRAPWRHQTHPSPSVTTGVWTPSRNHSHDQRDTRRFCCGSAQSAC